MLIYERVCRSISRFAWLRIDAGITSAMIAVLSTITLSTPAQTTTSSVYADGLASGWGDWSWATHALTQGSVVHSGTSAASFEPDGWGALFFHSNAPLSTDDVVQVEFWIRGAAPGGQNLHFDIISGGSSIGGGSLAPYVTGGAIPSGSWAKATVPLAALGVSTGTTFDGIWWQDNTGGNQSAVYIDEVNLVLVDTPLEMSVDIGANRELISQDIYGMNFAPETLAAELRLPVNRWGGNATTRYNWINDTSNRGRDWYFENIPDEETTDVASLPHTSAVNRFIDACYRTNTKAFMTMPCIGWTPKTRAYLGGFGLTPYGAQQDYDPWRPEWGNGIRPDGVTLVTGNLPSDTSFSTTSAYATSWVNYLKSRYGPASSTGIRLYNLDNEADLWHDTHRDVHPQPMTYDELWDFSMRNAHAIKQADPQALTLGPVSWGWTGYFTSPADWPLASPNPDRSSHGNQELVAWYLQKFNQWNVTTGTRLLDYLDLHFYPQAQGPTDSVPMYSGAQTVGNQLTQALRLRQTRTLWDSAYADESWIAEPVRLIPRMKDWINANYPGTKIAIGEYNWGAMGHINGAVAQAEVLGIFGREGVDLATMWQPPSSSQPAAYAFRMYRNYDGTGSRFGETRVQATSTQQSKLSIFASHRTASGAGGSSSADGALTIMVMNKDFSDQTTSITLAAPPATGGPGGGPLYTPAASAQVRRYSTANLNAIVSESSVAVATVPAGGGARLISPLTLPAQSITLLVIPSTTPIPVIMSEFEAD